MTTWLSISRHATRGSHGAKAVVALIAAYALSPIDLIPDFIPAIGYLDELILLPLVIAGVMHLTEPH